MITIPTLAQLYSSIKTNLETTYGSTIPAFGKNFLRAQAAVQAAKLKLYYLAIADLQKNIFIDTATSEAGGGSLERFGRVKLGRNPFPAVAGQYTVQLTGSLGGVIPALQTFKSDDDSSSPGMLFILDVVHVMVGATDTITLRALTGGVDSRLSIGDTLTATAPMVNVNSTATVTVEVVAPEDSEDLEDYRRKGLDAYRLEPQGGAATDYRLWASDASGVEQTYPYAKSGAANEINLYVEATIAASTDGKGTPTAAILTRVEEVVEFDPDQTKAQSERGRRPLGVFDVHYLPVTIRNVTIEIPDYVNLTAAIQTLITSSILEAVNTYRPFIPSCDIISEKNDILDVNKIVSVILVATPGASFGTVVLKIDAISVSTFTFTNGDIPYLQSVSFT